MRTDFKSVDEYIAAQPEAVRRLLRRVRSTIRKAVPGAEEVISYQIPTYKMEGGPVLYFAGWRQHYSFYPATVQLVRSRAKRQRRRTRGQTPRPLVPLCDFDLLGE